MWHWIGPFRCQQFSENHTDQTKQAALNSQCVCVCSHARACPHLLTYYNNPPMPPRIWTTMAKPRLELSVCVCVSSPSDSPQQPSNATLAYMVNSVPQCPTSDFTWIYIISEQASWDFIVIHPFLTKRTSSIIWLFSDHRFSDWVNR